MEISLLTQTTDMKRLRILCIKKITSGPYTGDITHIGGVNNNGDKWTISVNDAINGIKSGSYEFFIMDQFEEIDVIVAGEIEKGLTTKSLGEVPNLLLNLPDCP